MSVFNVTKKELSPNESIIIIDIEKLTPELSEIINKYFVQICEGTLSDTDINIVKSKVRKFLLNKDEKTRMGAIAEFFIHLYLNGINCKQECRFLNLEENSIKKGFDGYYSDLDNQWIMESKSGTIKTAYISHPKKIKEAYVDLKSKISGGAINNPWDNAYSHACNINVSTNRNIINTIKQFSDNYEMGTYYDIKDFYIIPGSTIFLDDTWIVNETGLLISQLEDVIKKIEYKGIKAICITKKSINLFETYC